MPNPNGAVRYALAGHASAVVRERFAIDETSGQLTLRQPLDYDSGVKLYSVPIVASDCTPLTPSEHLCPLDVHKLSMM